MLIGGLQKSSLLDYPDKIAAVIFTVGCNFRCGFCHNPTLAARPGEATLIDEREVLEFLGSRQGLLDAVVITGGEPTLHAGLEDLIVQIKEMGFLVKLDTNGTNPDAVERLIARKLVDLFAMDIKHRLTEEAYMRATGVPVDIEAVKRTIAIFRKSGVRHEFRTTLVKGLHAEADVIGMAEDIAGAATYVLQRFVPRDDLNDLSYGERESFDTATLERLSKECRAFVRECLIR